MRQKNTVIFIENLLVKASEDTIQNHLSGLKGMIHVETSCKDHTLKAVYDSDVLQEKDILDAIEACGYHGYIHIPYSPEKKEEQHFTHLSFLVIGLILLLTILVLQLMHFSPFLCMIPYFCMVFIHYQAEHAHHIFQYVISLTAFLCAFYLSFLNPDAHSFYFYATCLLFSDTCITCYLRSAQKNTYASKVTSLLPDTASTYRNKTETRKQTSNLKKEEVILIRPDEIIPVDGMIVQGTASIDESALTGSNRILEKSKGSYVYALSKCVKGSCLIRTEKVGEETAMMHFVRLAEETATDRSYRSPFHSFEGYLLLFSTLCAVLSFFGWLFSGKDITFSLTVAISILSCLSLKAFRLSSNLSLMKSARIALQKHILFKNSNSIDLLSKIDTAVIDQDGIITDKQLTVTDFIPAEGIEKEYLEYAAYSLAYKSDRPIHKSVLRYLKGVRMADTNPSLYSSMALQNRKSFQDTKKLQAGSMDELLARDIDLGDWQQTIQNLKEEGKRIILYTEGKRIIGLIAARKMLLPEAETSITRLRENDIELLFLTNGTEEEAVYLSKKHGIDPYVHKPGKQAKEEIFRNLSEDEKTVAYLTGNYPKESMADITAFFFQQADTEHGCADIVLFRNRLSDFIEAMKISQDMGEKTIHHEIMIILYHSVMILLCALAFPAITGYPLPPFISCIASFIVIFLMEKTK